MTGTDLRGYHRALLLYALHRATEPSTAGELAEFMGTLAQSEGHPKPYWIDISAPSVHGYLRSLANEGEVIRVDERRNSRTGRPEPTWTTAGPRDPDVKLPNPIEFEESDPAPAPSLEAPPPADQDPYESMTRAQLLCVLRISDEVGGAVARLLRDLDDIRARAQRELASQGLPVE